MSTKYENSDVGWIGGLIGRFGTQALLIFMALLFLVDVVIPDPLPWVDEILLAIGTLLVARFRSRSTGPPKPPPKNVTPKD